VTDRFQDGRRRHVGNSSACHKMGNNHPILMTDKEKHAELKNQKSGSVRPFFKMAANEIWYID
jgi:hypothetical protein